MNTQTNDTLAGSFSGYTKLLCQIKQRVLLAQQRAIYAANEEMLRMYWDIGKMLQQSQDADGWGKKTLQPVVAQLVKGSKPITKSLISQLDGYNFTLPIKHLGFLHLYWVIELKYVLRDIQKPIGISDYELGQALPKDFRDSLPTIEEIEKELESDVELSQREQQKDAHAPAL